MNERNIFYDAWYDVMLIKKGFESIYIWTRRDLVKAPSTCRLSRFPGYAHGDVRKRIFRIGGDGKVYRGVYLRLYKSCTKMFILAASTGWEAHRRRTAVFISRENAVEGPKKNQSGGDALKVTDLH